jgi:hypothetical protein
MMALLLGDRQELNYIVHKSFKILNNFVLLFQQLLQGNYLYSFGDHGGVIVATKYYRAGDATDQLLYSIDEGVTWQTHTFHSEKVRVLGLMTEPGENTTVFFIFASSLNTTNKHSWILIKIDFRDVFGLS